MKPTLLILAAGMGSRYGKLKQLDGVGPNDETLIEYSIYDAIKAGIEKVVFVIRKEFSEPFENYFESRLQNKVETSYVCQEVNISNHYPQTHHTVRKKPWGTGHAILCTRSEISDPFIMINADDYYGSGSYLAMVKFLKERCSPTDYALCTYPLEQTLSDNGSVSRGVCHYHPETMTLNTISEHFKISKKGQDIVSQKENLTLEILDKQSSVSMNFWGFHPSIFDTLETEFETFLSKNSNSPKAEFLIPEVVGSAMQKMVSVRVLPCKDMWYGLTYKEDKSVLSDFIEQKIGDKSYPSDLWF